MPLIPPCNSQSVGFLSTGVSFNRRCSHGDESSRQAYVNTRKPTENLIPLVTGTQKWKYWQEVADDRNLMVMNTQATRNPTDR